MVLRVITFKLDERLLEKIDRIALRERKSRSDIIRMALEEFIINYYYTVEAKSRVITLKVW